MSGVSVSTPQRSRGGRGAQVTPFETFSEGKRVDRKELMRRAKSRRPVRGRRSSVVARALHLNARQRRTLEQDRDSLFSLLFRGLSFRPRETALKVVLLVAIYGSILFIILESLSSRDENDVAWWWLFFIIDLLAMIIFIAEIIGRLWVADRDPHVMARVAQEEAKVLEEVMEEDARVKAQGLGSVEVGDDRFGKESDSSVATSFSSAPRLQGSTSFQSQISSPTYSGRGEGGWGGGCCGGGYSDEGDEVEAAMGQIPEKYRSRLRWAEVFAVLSILKRPSSLFDICNLLPSILFWCGAVPIFSTSFVASWFRLWRSLRVFKVIRYAPSISIMFKVASKKSEEITSSFLLSSLLIMITTFLIFVFEGKSAFGVEEDTKFVDLATSLYFTVATVTSVGYGDIAPKTSLGRGLSAAAALLGIMTITLPGSIIATGFLEYRADLERRQRVAIGTLFEAKRRIVLRNAMQLFRRQCDRLKAEEEAFLEEHRERMMQSRGKGMHSMGKIVQAMMEADASPDMGWKGGGDMFARVASVSGGSGGSGGSEVGEGGEGGSGGSEGDGAGTGGIADLATAITSANTLLSTSGGRLDLALQALMMAHASFRGGSPFPMGAASSSSGRFTAPSHDPFSHDDLAGLHAVQSLRSIGTGVMLGTDEDGKGGRWVPIRAIQRFIQKHREIRNRKKRDSGGPIAEDVTERRSISRSPSPPPPPPRKVDTVEEEEEEEEEDEQRPLERP